MRVLLKHVAWQLRVTWDQVEEIEADLAETLEYNTYVMSEWVFFFYFPCKLNKFPVSDSMDPRSDCSI